MSRDNQVLLARKETEITAFQQKLSIMEVSLSQLQSAFTPNNAERITSSQCPNGETLPRDHTSPETSLDPRGDLVQRLKCELDEERQNSKRAKESAENLQEMVLKFESEKVEMEARLQSLLDDLECAENQVREVQQYKAEKERLNQDVVRLDRLVLELQNRLYEEEETSKRLRSKYEAEIANCELRLQTLEEERVLNVAQLGEAHEAVLKRLQEEHSREVKQIQELLDQVQKHDLHGASSALDTKVTWIETADEHNLETATEEHQNLETATEGSPEAVLCMNTSVSDVLMERYLASAVQRESSWIEPSLEEHSIMEKSKLEFEDESRFLIHLNSGASNTNPEDRSPGLDGLSFTQAQWQSFNSTSNGMNESVDLGKELLIQQCQELTELLKQKERELNVLQEEVRHSVEELEEARERWSKASEELEEAKWDLETERDKRLHFEELLNEKLHEQDNLKNKLSYLENQKGREQLTEPDTKSLSTEELLKELKEDKVKLVLQLKHQEQLVRDIQEQKVAGDSVSGEVQALFGRQLSSLQSQRDQLMGQLENLREKNQTMSVLLGQKTIEVESAYGEIQQFRAEVEERAENVQRLEKVRAELESKLTCVKENLRNLEEALWQGSAEKAALEKRLQELEKQNKSMEKVLETELENFEVWIFYFCE